MECWLKPKQLTFSVSFHRSYTFASAEFRGGVIICSSNIYLLIARNFRVQKNKCKYWWKLIAKGNIYRYGILRCEWFSPLLVNFFSSVFCLCRECRRVYIEICVYISYWCGSHLMQVSCSRYKIFFQHLPQIVLDMFSLIPPSSFPPSLPPPLFFINLLRFLLNNHILWFGYMFLHNLNVAVRKYNLHNEVLNIYNWRSITLRNNDNELAITWKCVPVFAYRKL